MEALAKPKSLELEVCPAELASPVQVSGVAAVQYFGPDPAWPRKGTLVQSHAQVGKTQ